VEKLPIFLMRFLDFSAEKSKIALSPCLACQVNQVMADHFEE